MSLIFLDERPDQFTHYSAWAVVRVVHSEPIEVTSVEDNMVTLSLFRGSLSADHGFAFAL
jgi:hypothetical protein